MIIMDYRVVVRPLEDQLGGGYIAQIFELPGCMGNGATPEEAEATCYQAAAVWLDTARVLGRPIPAPAKVAA